MNTPIYRAIVENCASLQLSPELVLAVIHQESGGNPKAARYEPAFFRKYLKDKTQANIGGFVPSENRCSFHTEKALRGFSLGLFQVLGQTARENGFDGEFLTELLEPETNIKIGCKVLKRFLDEKGTTEAALLRWNGGANKHYPVMVMANLQSGAGDYMRLR